MRRSRLGAAVAMACTAALVAFPSVQAEGSSPQSTKLELLDSAGNPDTQAGSHPDRMLTRVIGEIDSVEEKAKDLAISFPVGMGGNPNSVPTCSLAEFDDPAETGCPADTQVGNMIAVDVKGNESASPVYNLVPAPDEVAAFGVKAAFLRFRFFSHLSGEDLSLSTEARGLLEQSPEQQGEEPIRETVFEFWGVPADHQGEAAGPRKAFLTLPTSCHGPLTATVSQRTWKNPDETRTDVASTGLPLTGCERLPFEPKVDFSLEKPQGETPTGYSLSLEFGESNDASALASAQAQTTRIEFPDGMGISPGAATHFTSCSDAQLGRGSDRPASCPASSRVGSVEVTVPQIGSPMLGDVYLGQELPGERFRLFVVSKAKGIETKFVGSMQADPVTGRLTTVLDNLPAAAISELKMSFEGGANALFVSPPGCSTATVTAKITPNSGNPPVTTSDSVDVGPPAGRGCGDAGPFSPTLKTALSNPHGGRPTAFSTLIERQDGEQSIDKFKLSFPSGLSARLGTVELCPAAAVAAASCPAASQVGTSYIEIGTGPETAELSGNAYLTGPQGKDPFGVAMFLGGKFGPFDLGTFSVTTGMQMDPLTGQVSVQTASLPQIEQGIPIKIRAIGLEIDRPGFMLAPTSCQQQTVKATIASTQGTTATPSSELGLVGCVALPFKPDFSLALTDRKEMRRHGRPGLEMKLRLPAGGANLKGLKMSLPSALRFNPGALKEICARRQAMRDDCPKASRVGSGIGRTPLLSKQMKGAIYVVQPQGDGEPDLWVSLHGQGMNLSLRSTSKVNHGHVENGFHNLPDVPMGEFTMEFADHGVLSLRQGLCTHGHERRLSAITTLTGHNGALRRRQIPIETPKACDR